MDKTRPAPKDLLSAALKLLSIRPRSVAELREKLLLKGFDAASVESALEELKGAGYLDDEKYAILLAGSRARNKNWGPSKIASELSSKGISAEIVRRVVVRDPEAEAAVAKTAFDRWVKKSKAPSPLDRKGFEKAYRFLKGRGFSSDAVFKVINRFKGRFEPDAE